jgi:hypothetical protein
MRTITLKLDLYEFSQLEKSCTVAAEKLGLRKDLLEQDLEQLMNLLEYYKDKKLHQKQSGQSRRWNIDPQWERIPGQSPYLQKV